VTNWQQLRRLPWTQRWLLVQAGLILPLTSLALRLLGFRRIRSVLTSLAPIDNSSAKNLPGNYVDQAHVTAWIVRAAASHSPVRTNCLQRSLILWWLLRRQGIESELRLGVRKRMDRFEAHAWVHFRDAPLNDHDDVQRRFALLEQPNVARSK
jgi:hypothetical protein